MRLAIPTKRDKLIEEASPETIFDPLNSLAARGRLNVRGNATAYFSLIIWFFFAPKATKLWMLYVAYGL